ncbi:MAG: bifunctional riboflavin kinase/FAD synthetase [Frankiaceae bacterium]
MQRWDGLGPMPADWPGCVVTIGVFDGVHRGHQRIIAASVERARERGLPAVVVTFEPHPSGVLRPGTQPLLLTTPRQKAELLAALGVDVLCVLPFTTEFSRLDAAEFVRTTLVEGLLARHVVVGANFRFGSRAAGDVALLDRLGAEWGFTVEGGRLFGEGERVWSSTFIRGCIAEGDVVTAAAALGRPHRVEGVVVHGDGRGRGLGYPTANLAAPGAYAVPADGVYAGWLLREPRSGRPPASAPRWPAAVSVGTNPTFDGVARRVEAYVLDREVDLYDLEVAVEFGERLRGMERFESVDALVEQMHDDVRRARELLAAGRFAPPRG